MRYDYLISDIEAQIRDLQSRKKDLTEEMKEKERVGLGESGFYDRDIYDSGISKYDGYVTSIAVNDEMEVRNNLWILFIQSGIASYSFQCFAWLCNPIGVLFMTKW
jgi:hypothetical protein